MSDNILLVAYVFASRRALQHPLVCALGRNRRCRMCASPSLLLSLRGIRWIRESQCPKLRLEFLFLLSDKKNHAHTLSPQANVLSWPLPPAFGPNWGRPQWSRMVSTVAPPRLYTSLCVCPRLKRMKPDLSISLSFMLLLLCGAEVTSDFELTSPIHVASRSFHTN